MCSLNNYTTRMIQCTKFIPIHISRSFKRFYSMKIAEILNNKATDETTTVKGWVKLIRKMKKRTFIDVSDGSTYRYLQVVLSNDQIPRYLSKGASVEATGVLKILSSGQIEMHPDSFNLVGVCNNDDGYPFSEKIKYNQEDLRKFLHFRPRNNVFATALRVRNKASHCVHEYFQHKKFVNIHTPIITSNDCEGAGEIFQVMPEEKSLIQQMKKENKSEAEAYFDRNVYLTVSNQLHLEVMARALSNVYQFGPTFRAENSKSRFHLSEFYMIEAEIAFMRNIEDLLYIIENMIKTVTEDLLSKHEEEITFYRKSINQPVDVLRYILNCSYHVMDFDEACSILKANSDQLAQPLCGNKHMSREHELFLVKYCAAPVFIIKWPENKKPFYAKSSLDETYVHAVDLLFPEVGELCGGSLREDDYDSLKNKLIKNQLLDKLEWYLELRKFGNVPTGGFGMGFERYLKVLLGTPSIKDTISFPRWPHNCFL